MSAAKDLDFLAFIISLSEFVSMEHSCVQNKEYMERNAYVYDYISALYRAFSREETDKA